MDAPDAALRAADLAIADQCRLNVLWLHSGARGERALEIAVDGLRLEDGLRALYREVECVAWPSGEAGGRAKPLPFPAASFDLVTMYGRAPSQGQLSEMRRLLRAGGTALLGFPNRGWRGCLLRGAPSGAAGPALVDKVVAAGFGEVRPYWVEPSLAVPRELIPARADRARAFEAVRSCETGRRIERLFAVAGLQRVLYPALLLVAKV